jgi:hypothetical protein
MYLCKVEGNIKEESNGDSRYLAKQPKAELTLFEIEKTLENCRRGTGVGVWFGHNILCSGIVIAYHNFLQRVGRCNK